MAKDDEVEPTPHGGTRIRTRSPTRRPLVKFVPIHDELTFQEAPDQGTSPPPGPRHALPPGAKQPHPAPPPHGPTVTPTRFKDQAQRLVTTTRSLMQHLTDALTPRRGKPNTFEILDAQPIPQAPPPPPRVPANATQAPPPPPPTKTQDPRTPSEEPQGPSKPQAHPAPPPTPPPSNQEKPVPVTPDHDAASDEDSMFTRLRQRFKGDGDDGDDEQPPEQEQQDGIEPEEESGIFARLKDRLQRGEETPAEAPTADPRMSHEDDATDETEDTAEEPHDEADPEEPEPQEPPRPPLEALENEGEPRPPEPPTDDERIPAKPPTQDEPPAAPEPSPASPSRAHPSLPHQGPSPTPPTASTPAKEPTGRASKRRDPEELHERIDAVLERYGEEPERARRRGP